MTRNLLAIRIWLILMIVAAISLTGTSALAQGGTVVRVEPAALSAKINDSVSLSIKAENITNLTAFELHLTFNPGVLEVVEVKNGGFVTADFTAQNIFDNTAGTLDYAVAQMNRNPAQGSGALVNITFRAKANGNSAISLRATPAAAKGIVLSNQDGKEIQVAWTEGVVTVGTGVTPATATPAKSNTPGPTLTKTNIPTATPAKSSTPGPSPTKTNTPAVSNTPIATSAPVTAGGILGTHVVRVGEYLYCIGRAYAVSPYAIAEENGIWWPYFVFPNQTLRIPNVAWSPIPAGRVCPTQFTGTGTTANTIATATATPFGVIATVAAQPNVISATATPIPPATATTVTASACSSYFVVRPGDTLYSIAQMFGTNYEELARVNQLADPRLIYAGQQLCIP